MGNSQIVSLLTTCSIAMEDGIFTVPCEVINDALVITPNFGVDRSTGKAVFGGDFFITHRPSGRTISDGAGCIECCRSAGKALVATGIDWASIDYDGLSTVVQTWGPALYRAVAEARTVNWSCDAENCDPWPTTDKQGS